MKNHKIQWLNLSGYKGETWNPIAGCKKVSPGCENCYAERMATRLAGMAIANPLPMSVGKYVKVIKGRKWDGTSFFNKEELTTPLKWKSPRVVFVCSMGDLFFEQHPFESIYEIYRIMQKYSQHIFIVLTKRPERMAEFYRDYAQIQDVIDNIWIGVTAENQEQANKRIPYLLEIPAAVRLVSVEPMLGPIDLTNIQHEIMVNEFDSIGYKFLNGKKFEGPKIDWVICGGESGHKARPMHPDWVRSVRDQCKAASVPFFFKQWGEYKLFTYDFDTAEPIIHKGNYATFFKDKSGEYFEIFDTDGDYVCAGGLREDYCVGIQKVGRHNAGNLLDGEKYEEYPSFDSAQDDRSNNT